MPSVEFYHIPESPPCRIVEMAANVAGVTLNKHYINLFTKDHLKEDYVKLNPLHKVPFIVDGDLKLNESRAIATYLISKYMPADNSLYPADPVKRARVDELLYLDMGTIDGSARKVFVPIIRGTSKSYDAEADKAFREALASLDHILSESKGKFALGDELTVADLSLAASLSFMESFEYDLSAFKSIKAYESNLKASIPKYAEINNEACENLRQHVKKLLAA